MPPQIVWLRMAGRANNNSVTHILSVPDLSDKEIKMIFGATLKKLLKIDTLERA
jgi:hypothetical protein